MSLYTKLRGGLDQPKIAIADVLCLFWFLQKGMVTQEEFLAQAQAMTGVTLTEAEQAEVAQVLAKHAADVAGGKSRADVALDAERAMQCVERGLISEGQFNAIVGITAEEPA